MTRPAPARSARSDRNLLLRALGTPLPELIPMIHAGLLFVLAEGGLRLLPLARLAPFFRVTLSFEDRPLMYPRHAPWFSLDERERRKMRAVRRLSPYLYGTERGCLRGCLVMGRLLHHRKPELRIGVRKVSEVGVTAHSWLEIDGVRLEPAAGFAPFSAAP